MSFDKAPNGLSYGVWRQGELLANIESSRTRGVTDDGVAELPNDPST